MELINSTRMVAGYTIVIDRSGRELLVVVVKGTFEMPQAGQSIRLAEQQVPLVMSDTFTGEPGSSSPLCEVDFSPRKPQCDVLLTGSAYAPGGRPTSRVQVGVRVGPMAKAFAVVGDREWRMGLSGVTASAPEPFTVMPITYDRAFGGVDIKHEDPTQHAAFMLNPVGRGFHKHLRSEWIEGATLPNTEETSRPVSAPDFPGYQPMSLGPLGRGWEPRSRYAGTYDEQWLAQHFPFLPPDFDERYFQSAPLDQQISYPIGGEQVRLMNLTPDGDVTFTLPAFDAPVHFTPRQGQREEGLLILDTIVLEPDLRRLTLTWRATRPLRKNVFDIGQVLVGKKSRAWWAKREGIDYPIALIPSSAKPA